jgi:hypothetical protein
MLLQWVHANLAKKQDSCQNTSDMLSLWQFLRFQELVDKRLMQAATESSD